MNSKRKIVVVLFFLTILLTAITINVAISENKFEKIDSSDVQGAGQIAIEVEEPDFMEIEEYGER